MADHGHHSVGPAGRAASVVTVSDGVAQGVRDDASGRAVVAALEEAGFDILEREVVPDDRTGIERVLRDLADGGVPLVVTTGGTGLGPRDVTPEATKAIIEREAPGLAEEMRAAGRGTTPFASLSRGVVGVRGATLIVNLPGSDKGALESLRAILPALPHALELLAGHTAHGDADAAPMRFQPGVATNLAGYRREDLASHTHSVSATAVKVHGNPPCQLGQKMLIGPKGPIAGTLGCAEFDAAAVADAPSVLESRSPATQTYTHELGSVEVYLEPHIPPPILIVFSATPVALHLMRWGRDLGFDPVLVEPRTDRVTAEHRAAGRVERELDVDSIDTDTSVVHTDHDAPGMAESLAELVKSPARFVGVMGSRRHVGPHMEQLKSLGLSDEQLARVRTPVGIDIGARTAEEIALSILAGVVAERRGATGGWLDRPQS